MLYTNLRIPGDIFRSRSFEDDDLSSECKLIISKPLEKLGNNTETGSREIRRCDSVNCENSITRDGANDSILRDVSSSHLTYPLYEEYLVVPTKEGNFGSQNYQLGCCAKEVVAFMESPLASFKVLVEQRTL